MSFVKTYTEHFRSYRHDVSDKARQYACGLMQAVPARIVQQQGIDEPPAASPAKAAGREVVLKGPKDIA
ncbi:MAG: hypothetical protein JRJ79_10660 [Deltaproteobacteria bacterium]|nr:hypothetical protein [Deltaproteobacteria bacterium]